MSSWRGIPPHRTMKKTIPQLMCGLALIVSPLCSSCSLLGLHTNGDLKEESKKGYQRGLLEGAAREARRAFYEEQLERERPKPPPELEYYKVPIPAHVDEDGVKVEAHTVTVPVLKQQAQTH